MREPRVCFLHNGVQLHNLDCHVQTVALLPWLLHTSALECPPPKSLDTYHSVIGWGLIRWGAHVHTMARWEGLTPSVDSRPCPACRQEVTANYLVEGCPWRHLFRLAVHSQLHTRQETFCTRWKQRAVTEWGVLVLCRPDTFAMSVVGSTW